VIHANRDDVVIHAEATAIADQIQPGIQVIASANVHDATDSGLTATEAEQLVSSMTNAVEQSSLLPKVIIGAIAVSIGVAALGLWLWRSRTTR